MSFNMTLIIAITKWDGGGGTGGEINGCDVE